MKRLKLKACITLIITALCISGLSLGVFARGTEENNQESAAGVGGGYAVTGQIPGVGYSAQLYDATNGLPTSEANCVLAASNGYIWIGGYSGIIRYDGLAFERITSVEGLTSGRGMFEDRIGRIWVATNDNGVVVMHGAENMHFTKVDGLPSSSIRTFAEDDDGIIYIGTTMGICWVDSDLVIHNIDDDRVSSEIIIDIHPPDFCVERR